jgi:hypothetical protein
MKIYSYMIDHDFGLAPNPFGKYCTVAVCKPKIRKSKNLKINDWLIGTGSKSLEKSTGFKCVSRLIYAMQVSEVIDLNSYWHDPRFECKKPVMRGGTLSTMFGDNFYYLDEDEKWVQIDCAHINIDGVYNKEHFRKDIGGKNVIISERFYYFGDNAPILPDHLINVCHTTQGEKIVRPDELATQFLEWLKSNFVTGMHGLPISWVRYGK